MLDSSRYLNYIFDVQLLTYLETVFEMNSQRFDLSAGDRGDVIRGLQQRDPNVLNSFQKLSPSKVIIVHHERPRDQEQYIPYLFDPRRI